MNPQIQETAIQAPTDRECVDYYRSLVLTRVFDRQMVLLQRQGKIGFTIQCEGEEACHVGIAANVNKEKDWIFPSYRQQGIALALGVPVVELAHQMFNNVKDIGSKGRQMPVHFSFINPVRWVSISSPLGTQIPQAAGCARAMQLKNENGVVFCCFGDGSTSTNGFHSGLALAGVWRAPVVFLCDNNQWAISVPTHKQTASTSFAIKGKAYGVRGAIVDGNNLIEVRRVVGEAAARARAGGGPTLIELVTYRIGGHSSSDDPRRYRDDDEVKAAVARDPILLFEKYLNERGLLNEILKTEIWTAAQDGVRAAVDEAAALPQPQVPTIFEDVYEKPTPRLARQREELLHTLARHGANTEAAGAFPL
ncbi:MAG: thiamine pyrophosphate-dependent dehydrogenase E1 component subunit alpha [Planctomycetes bacterium]|nr:thiamine pyrophosphate-dependent dehydrogenase E1 component subunit alpha [Planctomycetota bacterium]